MPRQNSADSGTASRETNTENNDNDDSNDGRSGREIAQTLTADRNSNLGTFREFHQWQGPTALIHFDESKRTLITRAMNYEKNKTEERGNSDLCGQPGA